MHEVRHYPEVVARSSGIFEMIAQQGFWLKTEFFKHRLSFIQGFRNFDDDLVDLGQFHCRLQPMSCQLCAHSAAPAPGSNHNAKFGDVFEAPHAADDREVADDIGAVDGDETEGVGV